ncbi:MAG: hypothetical protein H0W65_11850 [Sphingomonas sp.]|uniref:hypothetical protein n=1 Tax=Sphingomonas sp. TaxID=28214 RepID=UPI00179CE663|nr:hypothetical protein [Sphingomonas sp.]MBA3668392.1 hypothetical protein [Sphingomonas sp.]
MGIIAAHQQGLIEQLDNEVEDLAGRPGDHGQRAVVLHHLYDHSNGGHGWALVEARRALRIAAGLAALERTAGRLWVPGAKTEAIIALGRLRAALGEAPQARCAHAYRAYRLSATKALRGNAESVLPPDLLAALDACHAARREGACLDAAARRALFHASENFAPANEPLEVARERLRSTRLRRIAEKLVGERALAGEALLGERKGWGWLEARLRRDPALPASFRANPAQHYYALQRALQERRRKQWGEASDREADAVALAA